MSARWFPACCHFRSQNRAVHPRPRPGHHQLARHRLRSGGGHRRGRPTRVSTDLPAAGLGRARPRGDLGVADCRGDRGAGPRRTLRPRDVAAIGITNQRETTVVWDRETGEPIYNAIVWQDRRTADFCDRLKARRARRPHPRAHRPRHRRLLLRHQDRVDSRQRPRRAREGRAPASSRSAPSTRWLIWKLTGGATHVTDVSNASRTMLFNIHTLQWDDELLRLLDVPAQHAARGARLERGLRARRRRRSASTACRSPASPATSRRPCSARCACRRA